jgi:hypothetical protein
MLDRLPVLKSISFLVDATSMSVNRCHIHVWMCTATVSCKQNSNLQWSEVEPNHGATYTIHTACCLILKIQPFHVHPVTYVLSPCMSCIASCHSRSRPADCQLSIECTLYVKALRAHISIDSCCMHPGMVLDSICLHNSRRTVANQEAVPHLYL